MPFLEEIAAYLVAQNVGVLSKKDGNGIFYGSRASIPDGDGPHLTMIETGGSGSTFVQNKEGSLTERPTAQVAVRASTYNVARAMAKLAFVALNGRFNLTLSGTFYQKIVARQQLTDIGLDAKGRPMVVFNIEAEKQPS